MVVVVKQCHRANGLLARNHILMSLLLLFQVLITKQDVRDKYSLDNLRSTVEELISMNCVPIINENDVVASPPDLDLDLAGVSLSQLTVP